MPDTRHPHYQWYMLALVTISGTLVVAMPNACMPVLFKEISDDLGLSLVQIGTIWGMSSLAGIFVSIPGGLLGDKFGLKIMLVVCSLMAGITGASRGLAVSFYTLAATVFFNGLVRMIIPISLTKMTALWFKGQRLGLAMGISAVGMGLGLMLGPMLSATVLSPWLGGWRAVLYLYGGIGVLVSVLWFFSGREPPADSREVEQSTPVPITRALSKLIKRKELWFIGLTLLFRISGIMGTTGYLPMYLREQGWSTASADGTLAVFYALSTICVVPLSTLSDKFGSRKSILFTAIAVSSLCIILLPFAKGIGIWALMVLSGMFFDGFMAVLTTTLFETEGIGADYSGTALGIVFTIAQIGSFVAPPLGNMLNDVNPVLPFVFWACLSAAGLITLVPVKETGWRKKRAAAKGY